MNEYYFHFYGSMNSRSVEELINQILFTLQQTDCKKITILLSSEGGETDSRFTLYSFLRSLPFPLKMINMGSVDYQRVLEYTHSLKSDVNRYIKIFTERTSNAKLPIDIKQHLIGNSLIIDSDTWTDSGIVTGSLPSNWVPLTAAPQVLIKMNT